MTPQEKIATEFCRQLLDKIGVQSPGKPSYFNTLVDSHEQLKVLMPLLNKSYYLMSADEIYALTTIVQLLEDENVGASNDFKSAMHNFLNSNKIEYLGNDPDFSPIEVVYTKDVPMMIDSFTCVDYLATNPFMIELKTVVLSDYQQVSIGQHTKPAVNNSADDSMSSLSYKKSLCYCL